MSKKIGGIEEDVILIGGLVVGGYFIAKKILPDFGATPEELQTIQDQQSLPGQQNIFSPEYQGYADWFNTTVDWSGYNTSTELYQWLHDQYVSNGYQTTPAMGLFANIVDWAERLWHDLQGFILPNNLDDAIFILNGIQHKYQVGSIAEYLIDNYQLSLWTLLHNGGTLTVKGMSASDFVSAINRLNSLPD